MRQAPYSPRGEGTATWFGEEENWVILRLLLSSFSSLLGHAGAVITLVFPLARSPCPCGGPARPALLPSSLLPPYLSLPTASLAGATPGSLDLASLTG